MKREAARLLSLALLLAQMAMACGVREPSPTAQPASPAFPSPTPMAMQPPKSTSAPTATQPATVTPQVTTAATWTPQASPTTAHQSYSQEPRDDVTATLGSLRKIDDYPLYTMRYYGPYTRTAESAGTAEALVDRAPPPAWACSLFAALGEAESPLYGRNFDWRYSPALLLFTDPPQAYASVSMVDIAYLVSADDVARLAELPLQDRKPLLEAPFWPFDGMNEHGLVIGMAAVPESEPPFDQAKPSIDSLGVMREMLDHARDVDAAVGILRAYNVVWNGGPTLHYLLADASGKAVLIEFWEGEMVIVPSPTESRWHVATNHLRAPVRAAQPSGCWRYDEIYRRLAESEGRLGVTDAVAMLTAVAQENTQWSTVYDLRSLDVRIAMGAQYELVHTFRSILESPWTGSGDE